MWSIWIHLHFHHIKLCGIMLLACMCLAYVSFHFKCFIYNRGKSTHPGVVVDLCQNPEDPTRVKLSITIKTERFIRFCLFLNSSSILALVHIYLRQIALLLDMLYVGIYNKKLLKVFIHYNR
jgi:hypothetical protein